MIIMLDAYVYVSLCVQLAQVVHVFCLKVHRALLLWFISMQLVFW